MDRRKHSWKRTVACLSLTIGLLIGLLPASYADDQKTMDEINAEFEARLEESLRGLEDLARGVHPIPDSTDTDADERGSTDVSEERQESTPVESDSTSIVERDVQASEPIQSDSGAIQSTEQDQGHGLGVIIGSDSGANQSTEQGDIVSETPNSGVLSFTDVPADAYYAKAVEAAVASGITNGISPTTFAPNATCTRGQVATFLWRAKGSPEPETTVNPFTDVLPGSAFYKAILWAYENRITTGTSDTTFSPSDPCTRAHVLTFLHRCVYGEAAWKTVGVGEFWRSYYSWAEGHYWTEAYIWADATDLLVANTTFVPSEACPRSDIVYYLYEVGYCR